jgi:RNA polymerase sigma-70 factor, ECF subfamily
MNQRDHPSIEFEENRQYLFGIAYRMLGSVADAQDMVQEAFFRLHRDAPTNLRSAKAWLSTVLTRLCINHLKSARVQREKYIAPWLPEPLVEQQVIDPQENAKLADSLSIAFLLMLERLSPTERAVLLLREVFGYEFNEIAKIVEKSETNCRQLLRRAREHARSSPPRFETTPDQVEEVLSQFTKAAAAGDLNGLLKVLAEEAVAVTDGGGEVPSARKPIIGALKVARFILGTTRKFGLAGRTYRFAQINRSPGFIGYDDGMPVQAIVFNIGGGRLHDIFVINNPRKLKHLRPEPRNRDLFT